MSQNLVDYAAGEFAYQSWARERDGIFAPPSGMFIGGDINAQLMTLANIYRIAGSAANDIRFAYGSSTAWTPEGTLLATTIADNTFTLRWDET